MRIKVLSILSLALLVGIIWNVLAGSARAAKPVPGSTTGNTTKQAKIDLEWGPVRSARSLLGAVVKNRDGGAFGTIKDLGLDIGQGTVAAIYVTPAAPIGGKLESVSVPLATLQWTGAGGDIVLDAHPDAPAAATPGDPGAKSRVVLFSTLGNISVHNARGDKLGHVVDFGVARQKGLISSALLVLEADAGAADTLYPIPLAAFVVPANGKQWILELPAGILENTPTIKRGQWPTTVPRAWSEYVSVRYGRSPLGGVQTELNEKK